MAYTHFSGPMIVYDGQNNPDSQGPSLAAWGQGLLDTRAPFAYQQGAAPGTPFYGYLGGTLTLIDQAPSALAADNVAALEALTIATPMTLVSVSGAGITVGASVVNALTGATVTGLLAIDTAMAPLYPTASGAGEALWDPAKAVSRALSLTSGSNLSGLTITARGYDLYGYPITCTRAGPNNTTVNFTKAMKYVASITPSATNAGTMSVGTSDIYGLPLRADAFGYLTLYWNNALITANTGFVAAVTTDPSTALLGDVRGTYAVQSASDATKKLQLFWRPKAANLSQTGIWGISQV